MSFLRVCLVGQERDKSELLSVSVSEQVKFEILKRKTGRS